MCQGDPIRAGVLVAIMGPPEIKENNSYFIKCHFYTNGAREQCVNIIAFERSIYISVCTLKLFISLVKWSTNRKAAN